MTYGIRIGFPVELTEKDIKKIKRDLAYDKFGVVNGGKTKSKPTDADTAKSTGQKGCSSSDTSEANRPGHKDRTIGSKGVKNNGECFHQDGW